MPSNRGRDRRNNMLAKGNSPKHRQTSAKPTSRKIRSQAVEEIRASIAIRDSLLSEAEEAMTNAALKRASIANEFVETCLKPARTRYEAQHLSEADAIIERKRCAVVRRRIASLRANIAAHR
jgi:hypothetical protein